jgi:holliday junction DNA helicase RuvA
MYSYLKGTIVALPRTNNRSLVILEVQGIGYELQIPNRVGGQLTPGQPGQLFTHLQIREDQWTLFGFGTAAERDLFRQLISVSGIGAQLGIALLDSFNLPDLVQAIVSGNTKLLTRTPGVGSKTAERIALELKAKLAEWRGQAGIATLPNAGPVSKVQEDVEMTLLALGYDHQEIAQALQAVGQRTALAKNADTEDWIREAISWLSREGA